jgi:hypothetical protein
MGVRRYGLRDDQWERIEGLLPGRDGSIGRPAKDNRANAYMQRSQPEVSSAAEAFLTVLAVWPRMRLKWLSTGKPCGRASMHLRLREPRPGADDRELKPRRRLRIRSWLSRQKWSKWVKQRFPGFSQSRMTYRVNRVPRGASRYRSLPNGTCNHVRRSGLPI